MLPSRITDRIDTSGDCHEWQGARQQGYGRTWLNGRCELAHRVALADHLGRDVRELGLVMHLCDNPSCCNPEHLQEGTQKENIRHAAEVGKVGAPRKTHCKRGHSLEDPDNVYLHGRGRHCRACGALRMRKRRLS